jgi:hypothetical protein
MMDAPGGGSNGGFDFGGGNSGLAWGKWTVYFWSDEQEGGNSTINVSVNDGNLIINGEQRSNNNGSYAEWRADPNSANRKKLRTTATTISFKVKGDGKLYKAKLVTSDKNAAQDWNFATCRFTAPASEGTVTLNIADFQPEPYWGNTVPHDKAKITGIQFQLVNSGTFSLSMRDLTVN